MKIAIINEPWNGGATRCARDLCEGLREEHDVWYCPDDSKIHHSEVLGRIDSFNPDVVHLHSFYGWLHYETLLKIARCYPTVFTPHDPRPIGQIETECWQCDRNATCFRCPLVPPLTRFSVIRHRYFHQRMKRHWVHRRTPKSLTVVGVSRWFLKRLREQELGRFQLTHIPNGIDPTVFQRIPNAREQLSINLETQLVLFLSTPANRWKVNERKGLLPLAEVFLDRIAPDFPKAVLAVAGDLLIPNHPQVRGLGYLKKEDLPLWYSAADAFVLPSQADNLPYTVLEAMSCECPVVATSVGGIPEQVEDGETGFLVSDVSPDALAPAIRKILADPERAKKMGEQGRQKVLDTYSLDHFIDQHHNLYQNLLN